MGFQAIIIGMFYRFLGFFVFLFPLLSLAKFQVCSITINSSDEIEIFKEFLPDQGFEFVELLPYAVNEKRDHSSHWFDLACEKNYRCDILVISGHFGGTFFGKSSYSLPIELMEEKSCQNKCQGILSEVKEIFLFGCNTLANKTKDNRTYLEYLQVLLDDGMTRETAERVVAARYSPLETPFYDRMNFIFSSSHAIYGFDELSPLGKHMRKPLRAYFHSINQDFGSYSAYLKSEQYKRPLNKQLFQHLPRPHFTLNQAKLSLSHENRTQKLFFKNKCRLYDKKEPFINRVQALEEIFHSSKSGSAFFALNYFLNKNEKGLKEGRGSSVFRSIRRNPDLAEEFLSYYPHLNFLPYVKMLYLNILEKFQWMDPVELQLLRKETLLELIKKPDTESYASILLLLKAGQLKKSQFYVSKEDLSEGYVENIWGLLILEKLRAIAPDWQEEIYKHCEGSIKTPGMCYQSLNTLAHIGPKKQISRKVFDFLDSKDETLIYYSLRLLGQSGINEPSFHRKIAGFLSSENFNLKKEALEALGFLKSPYKDIQQKISQLLTEDELLIPDVFWSLNRMQIDTAESQRDILNFVKSLDQNSPLACQALRFFKKTSELSDFSLYFFYDLLESRENLDLLFCGIDSLSQNPNLRDLGIHYRFLLFQNEESAEIRQRALQSMESLTWLNPEVQLSFLNYFQDEDSKVRELATQVLKDIQNINPKTLEKIQHLYQKEQILELESFN